MKKYLALDLGGTFLKAAIIDEDINILKKWKVRSSKAKSVDEILEVFDSAIGDNLKGCYGIALACPGRIDVNHGIMLTAGYFDSFLKGFEIVKTLENRYHLPVSVDNDGKCAAIAEAWKGALKGVSNGLVYVIGTGIGGGIILNHKIYRGTHFASGELSQIVMNASTNIKEGNFLSDTVSTAALLKNYQKITNSKNSISGEKFFKLIKNGDPLANKIFNKFVRNTVKCFFTLQACFDFEVIAIGGGISSQDILIERLNKELDAVYSKYAHASVKPRIVRCKYLNDANLIGAVKSMIDQRKAK